MADVDVLVVGAGVLGMTAAIHAAHRGQRVCIVDPRRAAGGTIQSFRSGTRTFELGPAALGALAPLSDLISATGRTLLPYFQLRQVDPLLRIWFSDGVVLNPRHHEITARQLDQQFPVEHPGAEFLRWARALALPTPTSPALLPSRHQSGLRSALLEFCDGSAPSLHNILTSGLHTTSRGALRIAHALEQIACEMGVQWSLQTRISQLNESPSGVELATSRGILRSAHAILCPEDPPRHTLFLLGLSQPYTHLAHFNALIDAGPDQSAIYITSPAAGGVHHGQASGDALVVRMSAAPDTASARQKLMQALAHYGMQDIAHRLECEHIITPPVAQALFGLSIPKCALGERVRSIPPHASFADLLSLLEAHAVPSHRAPAPV